MCSLSCSLRWHLSESWQFWSGVFDPQSHYSIFLDETPITILLPLFQDNPHEPVPETWSDTLALTIRVYSELQHASVSVQIVAQRLVL